MPRKKMLMNMPKQLAQVVLVLLLSVSGGLILPQGAVSQENKSTDNPLPEGVIVSPKVFSARGMKGVIISPEGTPYDPQGMEMEYGPNWRDVIKDYDKRVAVFHDAQQKKLQGAEEITFSEKKNIRDLIRSYPFLKKDLQGMKDLQRSTPASLMSVRIAQSLNRETGVNIFFVYKQGPLYRSHDGCILDVYVDRGSGYKKAERFIYRGLPIHVSRASGVVSLLFDQLPSSVEKQREWLLKNFSFEENEPPEE